MSRGRRFSFAAMALLLGILGSAMLIEAALRLFDPIGRNYEVEFQRYRDLALRYAWHDRPAAEIDLDGTLYRHHGGLDLDLGSFRLRTNALGFRGPEVALDKPVGTFRIVVLGDSVAFGWGVDDEVTFLRRFERELAQTAVDGVRFEVVNTGHPMYDTTQELALLREIGLDLAPDLVLLVYVVNDVEPTRDVVEEHLLGRRPDPAEALPERPDPWTRAADLLQGILPATATLLRLQSDPVARFLAAVPPGTRYTPENFGKGPRGWRRSQQALLAMRDLCGTRGVPFVVLDHSRPPLEALPPFCRDHGIPCFDFRFDDDELALPIYNSRLDTHSNARGHELLLRKLLAIAPRLPIPRR